MASPSGIPVMSVRGRGHSQDRGQRAVRGRGTRRPAGGAARATPVKAAAAATAATAASSSGYVSAKASSGASATSTAQPSPGAVSHGLAPSTMPTAAQATNRASPQVSATLQTVAASALSLPSPEAAYHATAEALAQAASSPPAAGRQLGQRRRRKGRGEQTGQKGRGHGAGQSQAASPQRVAGAEGGQATPIRGDESVQCSPAQASQLNRGQGSRRRPSRRTSKALGTLLLEYVRQRTTASIVLPQTDVDAVPDVPVKVMLRLRPQDARDRTSDKPIPTEQFITVKGNSVMAKAERGAEERIFTYNAVYEEHVSQRDVYIIGLKPLLPTFLRGINVSLFCYGQTGSGKTWTMFGSTGATPECLGLVPRALATLFGHERAIDPTLSDDESLLESEACEGNNGPEAVTNFTISALEIYNEEVRDLSLVEKPKLEVREDPTRGIYVDGLRQATVLDIHDATAVLERVMAHRSSGATAMNARSSRSHVVFTVTAITVDGGDIGGFSRRKSKLHLVDLAGSERIKRSKVEGQGQREGAAINLSLSCLGNVINALVSGKTHVPYRESKLTRILQDSLGGNSITSMIATVSPAMSSSAETLRQDRKNTLRFADRVKQVKNQARINYDPAHSRLIELMAECDALRAERDALRTANAELQSKLIDRPGCATGAKVVKSRACILL